MLKSCPRIWIKVLKFHLSRREAKRIFFRKGVVPRPINGILAALNSIHYFVALAPSAKSGSNMWCNVHFSRQRLCSWFQGRIQAYLTRNQTAKTENVSGILCTWPSIIWSMILSTCRNKKRSESQKSGNNWCCLSYWYVCVNIYIYNIQYNIIYYITLYYLYYSIFGYILSY